MSHIYQQLACLSAAARLPRRWSFVPAHPSVRCVPRDPGAILTALRERFSEEALEEAGVIKRDTDAGVQMSATLQAEPRLFVVLRRSQDATPEDILGPAGLLSGRILACLSAAGDASTAEELDAWQARLFAAFDIWDLAILRSLGIPATLAVGLDRLNGAGLRSMLGRPNAAGHANPSAAGPSALWAAAEKLILVGWSVARLSASTPNGLKAIASLLGGAGRLFGFDTSRILVWKPTKTHLERIRFAVALRDFSLLREGIADSVNASLRPIDHLVDDQAGLPAGEAFLRARHCLTEELRREQEIGQLSYRIPGLVDVYGRAYERAILDPLVREAATADSPLDRAVSLAAADLMREIHNASPLVVGCQEGASRTRLPWSQPRDPESLKSFLKIVRQLTALLREKSK